jgi:SAM-dependent methyltransferase
MFCAKCVVSTGGFNAHGLPQLRGKIAFLVRISMLGGRMSSFLEHNRQAWDERMRRRDSHTESAADSDFRDPLAAADSLGWLGGNVQGRRILCLAAGGGKHGALFAAAGADVTVVDLSPAMLERDRAVAIQRGLKLRTVEASMTDLSMLAEGSFDAVVQPVSSCYVPDVIAVYRSRARHRAGRSLHQPAQAAVVFASGGAAERTGLSAFGAVLSQRPAAASAARLAVSRGRNGGISASLGGIAGWAVSQRIRRGGSPRTEAWRWAGGARNLCTSLPLHAAVRDAQGTTHRPSGAVRQRAASLASELKGSSAPSLGNAALD